MCTGRIDPALVADAFANGADGVLVIGCHFGDCHYVSGNTVAKHKLDLARETLAHAGLNPVRLQFHNLSSAEAAKFAQYNTDFVAQIKETGPLGTGDEVKMPKLRARLEVARMALAGPKLRWVIGKKAVFLKEGNKYGETFTEHEINRTLSGMVIDEMATHAILSALEKKPATVKNLAQELDLSPPDTLKYVLALKRRGFVQMDGVKDRSPTYKYRPENGVHQSG